METKKTEQKSDRLCVVQSDVLARQFTRSSLSNVRGGSLLRIHEESGCMQDSQLLYVTPLD